MFIKGFEVYVAMSNTKFAGMVLAGLMAQSHVPQAFTVVHSEGISYPEWQPFCELMMDRGCEVKTWRENLREKPIHFGQLRLQQIKSFQGEIITLLDDDIILSSGALFALHTQCSEGSATIPRLVQAARFNPAPCEDGIRYITALAAGMGYPSVPLFPPYGLTAHINDWKMCKNYLDEYPSDSIISSHMRPVVQFAHTATMVQAPGAFSNREAVSMERTLRYRVNADELVIDTPRSS